MSQSNSPKEEYFVSKTQRNSPDIIFFFSFWVAEEARCDNLSYTLKRVSGQILVLWYLDFTEIEGPGFSLDLFPTLYHANVYQ